MASRFVTDWRLMFENAIRLMSHSSPFFLARIGGSDTDAVAAYAYAKETGGPDDILRRTLPYLSVVKQFNGYYDRQESEKTFLDYLAELEKCYSVCDHLFISGPKLLSLYFPTNAGPKKFPEGRVPGEQAYRSLMKSVGRSDRDAATAFFPYSFIEKMVRHHYTLFRAFSHGLQGKKVLVVSPFSKSIESNFTNRRDFFKDYHYPAFELRLQTTPITYAGLPDEFYPDQDWLATTERLKNEISQINFDIALLGCGSYAMPLGIHIRDTLKKQAIYVGGVLQLYFGVMGRRYQDVFFTDQINLEKFIFPLEGQELLKHVTINEKTAREAFGAYF